MDNKNPSDFFNISSIAERDLITRQALSEALGYDNDKVPLTIVPFEMEDNGAFKFDENGFHVFICKNLYENAAKNYDVLLHYRDILRHELLHVKDNQQILSSYGKEELQKISSSDTKEQVLSAAAWIMLGEYSVSRQLFEQYDLDPNKDKYIQPTSRLFDLLALINKTLSTGPVFESEIFPSIFPSCGYTFYLSASLCGSVDAEGYHFDKKAKIGYIYAPEGVNRQKAELWVDSMHLALGKNYENMPLDFNAYYMLGHKIMSGFFGIFDLSLEQIGYVSLKNFLKWN